MRAPVRVSKQARASTIAMPSGRIRIQSAAPGKNTPLKSGPANLPSISSQLIRSPSAVGPTACLRTEAESENRNRASQAQRGLGLGLGNAVEAASGVGF